MKRHVIVLLLAAGFLPSCSHFKPTRLLNQAQTTTTAVFDTPALHASAHLLTHHDLTSTARTLTDAVEFVAVTVKNKTAHQLTISATSLSPVCMSAQELSSYIPQQYGRYFIPAAAFTIGGLFFTWQLGLPFAALFTLFGFDQSYRAADRTLTSIMRSCPTTQAPRIIAPYASSTFLVAISKQEYTGTLSFTASSATTSTPCHLQLLKRINNTYTLI